MKTSQQIFASLALGAGILLALPGIAQADNDRPRVGVNFSFGAPVYEQPAYVYEQPRAVYYDNSRYDRRDDYYSHEEDHQQWRDHHDEDDEDDD